MGPPCSVSGADGLRGMSPRVGERTSRATQASDTGRQLRGREGMRWAPGHPGGTGTCVLSGIR